MDIRVTYDHSANAAFIYLATIGPGKIARTVEAVPQTVLLDFDDEGRLLGIEVLNARRMLPRAFLDRAERLDG